MPKKKKRRTVHLHEARRILIDEELKKLVDMDDVVNEALDRVENHGIIFIDELDKIAGERGTVGPDVSREGVQRDLLPIVEGSTVQTRYGFVRTDHILFIAAGAFHATKPSDLIPELQGRFPIRVELQPLTEADFVRIMTGAQADGGGPRAARRAHGRLRCLPPGAPRAGGRYPSLEPRATTAGLRPLVSCPAVSRARCSRAASSFSWWTRPSAMQRSPRSPHARGWRAWTRSACVCGRSAGTSPSCTTGTATWASTSGVLLAWSRATSTRRTTALPTGSMTNRAVGGWSGFSRSCVLLLPASSWRSRSSESSRDRDRHAR